ncbi:MAG TPA: TadE/TadG family type IV pilus assembly protein [Stellaceae bacterium]|nr:TadE/TadG family type IV pilus assembly protein [Stellaceae bacterium]
MSRVGTPAMVGFSLSTARQFARASDGATALEFAIVAPVLLMLLLGIMEAGRALWTQNALNFAVEQAARCAAIDQNNCGLPAQVQSFAANVSGADFTSSIFTVTAAACGNLVSASYPMQLNIPYVSAAPTLTAQSCYP